MKIKGTKTELVDVEVPFCTLIDTVVDTTRVRYLKEIGIPPASYINPKTGQWETWEDGHGSGSTERHRLATVEETYNMERFRWFSEFAIAHLKKNGD